MMASGINLMCEILRGGESIVSMQWMTKLPRDTLFQDLFELIAPVSVRESPVTCKIGHKQPQRDASQFVSVLLTQEVQLVELQGGNCVRFEVKQVEGISFYIKFCEYVFFAKKVCFTFYSRFGVLNFKLRDGSLSM